MPHARNRYIIGHFKKLKAFWPIVGILSLRQVGKSYFLRELAELKSGVTLDDDDVREEASASAKVFLSKQSTPFVIDEIQKVPKLFDALKNAVDKKIIPGQWIVTGSVLFQNLSSIRLASWL
jgi:predicted AAA+ superfamily ATPase